MADHHVQGSVAFICTAKEAALIEEAWQHAADLDDELAPGNPSAEFLAAFPPVELGNPFNGLLAIFDDPRFPQFSAELRVTGADPCRVSIYGDSDFKPDAIAALIQRCCRQTLGEAPIGFTWSYGSSRPRPEDTGGGWCAIFADRIEFSETAEGLSKALQPAADPWSDHPFHPVSDWRTEVANDATRLGYLDWIAVRQSSAGAAP
ncbi:hypothetical protein GS397_05070 [Sphingobium yanoikuyae]|uniref:Uncharacterized protein n=2 Tax=Sphingobium TaxID=165695 RepID=A0A6P1GDC9_SPHYA|nr:MULTISPECIES: hypothetical protein [Sphingobium]MBB4150887.1 hypothetical protein [Sphingobium scionense]PZU12051.1 MAG: hypothetical protein DI606_10665 [Sphingobium sp.]QHD66505.1 hypothetical protein GS397_05070 [Sphingobium yanoikuyae]QNG48210.1 hypothetical protein H3V42_11905 [Sphingobium yanoikuyae]